MAHGLEGRVPFLDIDMIEISLTIQPELKLHENGGSDPIEKWVLRKACEDLLPEEIVWRDKEQFDEGSGTVDLLGSLLQHATEGINFEAYSRQYPADRLKSVEECYYHKLLIESMGGRSEVVFDNVGRWAERPPGIAAA